MTHNKGEENMRHRYKRGGKDSLGVRKTIKEVVENCEPCQKRRKTRPKPKLAFPKATSPNYMKV